ncbi:hypothetical protein CUT44_04185 [Streptomyces carminius]|uniref:Uncharacterized protein n=1 Tax=Streptomyces carminius TaxID=2665496 RepID=A0A2M8M665_9ACTN|nr:hypothetical protein [Streptomyces carminius]PJE99701.1 hypothetical protein CUT44_04185 [Streptomyces carminius]
MGTEPVRQGDGEEARDPWDELVLDEEFIRDARVNEPAARTRMLRARWQGEPPEPQPWRADGPPAGGLGPEPGRRRRGRWWRRRKG